MITKHRATVGQWYLHRDSDETFRVVAVDADSGVVETQTFDGTVEELDAEGCDVSAIFRIDIVVRTGPILRRADGLNFERAPMSAQDWRSWVEVIAADQDARSAAVVEDVGSAGLRRYA